VKKLGGNVLHLDFAPIAGSGTRTPQGFYRYDTALGRAGVANYNWGGETVRVLRPPDEVFALDSMKSAWGAVLTDKHPPRAEAFITTANVAKYGKGYCTDSVRRDGNVLRGSVVVQDGEIVALINSGERKEISPGYLVDHYDYTPGRWNGKDYGPDVLDGEQYDCVQRGITYNSIGIGPSGWGRQGPSVALDGMEGYENVAVCMAPEAKLGAFIQQQMLIKGLSLIDLAMATGIIRPADTDYEGEDLDPLLRQQSSRSRTSILDDIICGYTDRPSDEQLQALATALDVPLDSLIQRLPAELVKLDSAQDEPRTRHQIPLPNMEPKRMAATNETTVTLTLDGVDTELPKSVAPLVQRALADRDKKITTLETAAAANATAMTAQKVELDSAKVELGKAQTALAEAPAKLAAATKARTTLESQARERLGDAVTLDGLSDRAVREAVIKHWAPDLALDGTSEDYVAGMYAAALAKLPKQSATSKVMGAAFGGPNPHLRVTTDAADGPDPKAERAAMTERHAQGWKPKTTASA
jgi:hypothetical protein